MLSKILYTPVILLDIFALMPMRIWRLFKHLITFPALFQSKPTHWWITTFNMGYLKRITYWVLELTCLLLETIGIVEIYELITGLIKLNTRTLHHWERELAQSIFGDNLPYHRIRIDEYAFIGPRQWRMCYVSFNTVNSWGLMNNSLLIHELVHIWQYHKQGATYIPQALMAQHTELGYNYGGVKGLMTAKLAGKDLSTFNLEQQADIVADYYRLRNGYATRWGKATASDLPLYEHFMQAIRAPMA